MCTSMAFRDWWNLQLMIVPLYIHILVPWPTGDPGSGSKLVATWYNCSQRECWLWLKTLTDITKIFIFLKTKLQSFRHIQVSYLTVPHRHSAGNKGRFIHQQFFKIDFTFNRFFHNALFLRVYTHISPSSLSEKKKSIDFIIFYSLDFYSIYICWVHY